MMKTSLTLLVVLLVCACQQPQQKDPGFEGVITYAADFVIHDSAKVAEQLPYIDDSSRVYFKAGKMFAVNYGSAMEWHYFDQPSNILYYCVQGADTIGSLNGMLDYPEPIDISVQSGVDTVLGYVCDRLTMTHKEWEVSYSYSSKIPANPDLFTHTTLQNYNQLYKLSKAYYLAAVYREHKAYTSVHTAARVRFEEIPDHCFPDMQKIKTSSQMRDFIKQLPRL